MCCGLCRLHNLHNRVKGHKQQSSAIAKHYNNVHGAMPQDLLNRFEVLKKCKNKFNCLVYEMLFVREKPTLSWQLSLSVYESHVIEKNSTTMTRHYFRSYIHVYR